MSLPFQQVREVNFGGGSCCVQCREVSAKKRGDQWPPLVGAEDYERCLFQQRVVELVEGAMVCVVGKLMRGLREAVEQYPEIELRREKCESG